MSSFGRREYDVPVVPALRNVNWTRFWAPRDGSIHVEDGGYLIDPEGEHGKVWNPSVEKLELLVARPCLVQQLLYANLALDQDLERDIAGAPEFRCWFEGQTPLHFFLDSLDEHRVGGAIAVANWLLR